MHVDVARAADGAGAETRPRQHRRQPGPAAGAEHQLGGVLGAGEAEQGLGDVVPDDLVVGAAQRLDQPPLLGQRGRVRAGQAVGPGHVHGEQVPAGGPGGDPCPAADQLLAFRASGQRDHHALAGLPGAADAVLGAVALQALVHLVGQPQQGQLAQGGEVAGAEVVGQRGVDLLRRVDVAVRHPAAERLRGDVDQLDLVGGADHGVRDGFPLRHAGDLLHDVVEGLQVLDVDVGDDVDARGQQLLDVFPALGVPRSGHVRVRELVDQRDLGLAGQHGVEVHLLERRAAVGDPGPGDDLQAVQQRRGVRPAVRLHEGHDHVGAALGPPVALAEHVKGLPGACRCAQVDPELPTLLLGHGPVLSPQRTPLPVCPLTSHTVSGGGCGFWGQCVVRAFVVRALVVRAVVVRAGSGSPCRARSAGDGAGPGRPRACAAARPCGSAGSGCCSG